MTLVDNERRNFFAALCKGCSSSGVGPLSILVGFDCGERLKDVMLKMEYFECRLRLQSVIIIFVELTILIERELLLYSATGWSPARGRWHVTWQLLRVSKVDERMTIVAHGLLDGSVFDAKHFPARRVIINDELVKAWQNKRDRLVEKA